MTSKAYQWKVCTFDELNTKELYDLLQLRSDVFQIEQKCLFPDLDGKDIEAIHVLASVGLDLAGYARILKDPNGTVSIGRVVTDKQHRNSGLGRKLMELSIDTARERFGAPEVTISAQAYLLSLYAELGFEKRGALYLEDGIPHQGMKLTIS